MTIIKRLLVTFKWNIIHSVQSRTLLNDLSLLFEKNTKNGPINLEFTEPHKYAEYLDVHNNQKP